MTGLRYGNRDSRGGSTSNKYGVDRIGQGPTVTIETRRIHASLTRLSWILLVGATSCSPYSFPKEVTAISTSVGQLSDGFTSGYAQLAADRAAQIQLDLTGSRAEAVMASSCLSIPSKGSQDLPPCTLFRKGSTPPALSAVEQKRGETTAMLADLKDYANALAAVSNAADRTAFNAVAQLSGSVGALATAAGPASGGLSAAAPAVVNIFGWLVGTALDQQRFDALKAGVTAASTPLANGEIPINHVATLAGSGLFALSLARRAVLVPEANVLMARLGPALSATEYKQALSDAQAVVAVLDGLRLTDPTAAATGLVKAHEALVKAVNDPTRYYPSLLKAVSDFSDQAAALQKALAAPATAKSAATTTGK
jgi:hypothetical protein